MSVQLPLSLGLKDSANFAAFLPGANEAAVAYLQGLYTAVEPNVYLWGPAGAGKSHLLQALCHAAGDAGRAACYLPMNHADQFAFEALEGLETMDLLCIDDIHAIADDRDWEQSLVRLIERVRGERRALVVTGNGPIPSLGLMGALASRLAWGMSFQIHPLDDTDRLAALNLRAQRRGLQLPLDTGRFLMKRFGDDTTGLFATLDALDRASMAAKRRLTLPFVRSVLDAPRQ